MKLKTLLLGSATALAVAGSAQAADLSVAEPVDYVRVCDAFGTGYWYIPGTDTCLKIWGFVRWDANYYPESYYHYDFYTAAYIEFSAKSMTDWGPLEAYMGAWQWGFDTAYISLGPLLVGRTTSTFAQAYPWGTRDSAYSDWFQTEHYADQIRLSWAMNGFGVMVALEEPDGWGYESSMPDVVAALTWSNAMMDGKVSFVYSDALSQWGDAAADYWSYGGFRDAAWAVSAGVVIKLDSVSSGDKLLLKAAYGNNAAPYVLGYFAAPWYGGPYGWMWSAMASFTHFFAPNFSTNITVNYADGEYFSNGLWQGSFNVSYSPAPTLWITPEVSWANWGYGDTDWWFRLRIQKVFY